jgi:nucleoside-diphosphate-sugar epimerase
MSLAIPKDSLVLVTGCNGFIGSNTVDHFLEAGYRVRGTTRNVSKIQGLSALWEKKYGKGRFEAATVTDMAKEGAFDEAVKGK